MRTHGHKEGSTTHLGLLGGMGRDSGGGSWGGIAWREMPDIGEGEEGSELHCHVCTYATSMFFTCTPKPKMQLKKYIKFEMPMKYPSENV